MGATIASERARLVAAAQRIGATVEWMKCPRGVDVNVNAPHRKLWSACSVHTLAANIYKAEWQKLHVTWVTEMVEHLLSDMAHGLTDCAEVDCDVCDDPEVR